MIGLNGSSYSWDSGAPAVAASKTKSKTGAIKAHNWPGAVGATAIHAIASSVTSATDFKIQCAELCCDRVKNPLPF